MACAHKDAGSESYCREHNRGAVSSCAYHKSASSLAVCCPPCRACCSPVGHSSKDQVQLPSPGANAKEQPVLGPAENNRQGAKLRIVSCTACCLPLREVY